MADIKEEFTLQAILDALTPESLVGDAHRSRFPAAVIATLGVVFKLDDGREYIFTGADLGQEDEIIIGLEPV